MRRLSHFAVRVGFVLGPLAAACVPAPTPQPPAPSAPAAVPVPVRRAARFVWHLRSTAAESEAARPPWRSDPEGYAPDGGDLGASLEAFEEWQAAHQEVDHFGPAAMVCKVPPTPPDYPRTRFVRPRDGRAIWRRAALDGDRQVFIVPLWELANGDELVIEKPADEVKRAAPRQPIRFQGRFEGRLPFVLHGPENDAVCTAMPRQVLVEQLDHLALQAHGSMGRPAREATALNATDLWARFPGPGGARSAIESMAGLVGWSEPTVHMLVEDLTANLGELGRAAEARFASTWETSSDKAPFGGSTVGLARADCDPTRRYRPGDLAGVLIPLFFTLGLARVDQPVPGRCAFVLHGSLQPGTEVAVVSARRSHAVTWRTLEASGAAPPTVAGFVDFDADEARSERRLLRVVSPGANPSTVFLRLPELSPVFPR